MTAVYRGRAAGRVRAAAGPGGVALMAPARSCTSASTTRRERGGIETVLEAACAGAGAFIEPRALVLNTGRRTVHETVDGIPVTRVASLATVGAVSLTPSLAWWLRRAEADVVVLHEPNPMALVAVRARASGGAADRLVPQRGDPRRGGSTGCSTSRCLNWVLRPRRAHHRGRAADARRAGAGRVPGQGAS